MSSITCSQTVLCHRQQCLGVLGEEHFPGSPCSCPTGLSRGLGGGSALCSECSCVYQPSGHGCCSANHHPATTTRWVICCMHRMNDFDLSCLHFAEIDFLACHHQKSQKQRGHAALMSLDCIKTCVTGSKGSKLCQQLLSTAAFKDSYGNLCPECSAETVNLAGQVQSFSAQAVQSAHSVGAQQSFMLRRNGVDNPTNQLPHHCSLDTYNRHTAARNGCYAAG